MSDSGHKSTQSPSEGSAKPEPQKPDLQTPDRQSPGIGADEAASTIITQLYREFGADLQRVAWVILRDWQWSADAVQESFILLSEKFGEIPDSHRRGWLVRTVQLVSHNLRRKHRRHDSRIAQGIGTLDDQLAALHRDENVEQALENQELVEQVRLELCNLPEEQSRVLKLRFEEGLSFASIANELNLPLGTVLSRTRLAIAKIRKALMGQSED